MITLLLQFALSFAGQVAAYDGDLVGQLRSQLRCPAAPVDGKLCEADLPSALLDEAAALEAPSFWRWFLTYGAHRMFESIRRRSDLDLALALDAAGDTAVTLILLQDLLEVRPQAAAVTLLSLEQRHGWGIDKSKGLDSQESLERVRRAEDFCVFDRTLRELWRLQEFRDSGPANDDDWHALERDLSLSPTCQVAVPVDKEQRFTVLRVAGRGTDYGSFDVSHYLLIDDRPDSVRVAGRIASETSDGENYHDRVELRSVSQSECDGQPEIWAHTAEWDNLNCSEQLEESFEEEDWKPWVESGLFGVAPVSDPSH